MSLQVTCTAPVNIAVLKYWGKKDETLITPINSSFSVTLNQADLCTTTTVHLSTEFTADRIWLNGKEEDINTTRLQNCLNAVRKTHGQVTLDDGTAVDGGALGEYKVHIVSKNNFPTAAGLASSASGYACLVATLARAYNVQESFPGQLTTFARMGSGSACRSLAGGFVKWEMGGAAADASDSLAVQKFDEAHWPDLAILVLVVNDGRKGTSSTSGMQTTVRTSKLLQRRIDTIADEHYALLEKAVAERDFATFGEVTMRDSNQFHALCLDTFPPIFYLNDTSKSIIQLVHAYNAAKGGTRLAYTFDAGPNAVLFTQKADLDDVLRTVLHYYPPADGQPLAEYFPKADVLAQVGDFSTLADDKVAQTFHGDRSAGQLKYILHTTPGPGPQNLDTHLAPPQA